MLFIVRSGAGEEEESAIDWLLDWLSCPCSDVDFFSFPPDLCHGVGVHGATTHERKVAISQPRQCGILEHS